MFSARKLATAADRLGRVHGLDAERTRAAVEKLEETADLTVRPFAGGDAWRTMRLRVTHYHRSSHSRSLADCHLLARARDEDTLLSSDPDLRAVAARRGIEARSLTRSAHAWRTAGRRGYLIHKHRARLRR